MGSSVCIRGKGVLTMRQHGLLFRWMLCKSLFYRRYCRDRNLLVCSHWMPLRLLGRSHLVHVRCRIGSRSLNLLLGACRNCLLRSRRYKLVRQLVFFQVRVWVRERRRDPVAYHCSAGRYEIQNTEED